MKFTKAILAASLCTFGLSVAGCDKKEEPKKADDKKSEEKKDDHKEEKKEEAH